MFTLITNEDLQQFFARGDMTGAGLGDLVDTRRAYAQGQQDTETFPDGFTGFPHTETVILNRRGNGQSVPPPPPAPLIIPAVVSALPASQMAALTKDNGVPAQSNYNPYPFSVGRLSYQVLQENKRRIALIVFNLSAASNLYVNFGLGASPSNGLLIAAQSGYLFDAACPVNAINVYMDAATNQNGIVLEGNPL